MTRLYNHEMRERRTIKSSLSSSAANAFSATASFLAGRTRLRLCLAFNIASIEFSVAGEPSRAAGNFG